MVKEVTSMVVNCKFVKENEKISLQVELLEEQKHTSPQKVWEGKIGYFESGHGEKVK